MGSGALLAVFTGDGESAVVDDGLMMVLDDDLLLYIPFDILAVDLCAGVFALTQSTDIEVVVENALYRYDAPFRADIAIILIALRFLAHLLAHSGCGAALVGQMVGDFLIAPAFYIVKVEDFSDNIRFGGNDLEFIAIVDDISVVYA